VSEEWTRIPVEWRLSLRRDREHDPERTVTAATRWANRWAARRGLRIVSAVRLTTGEVGEDFIRNRVTLRIGCDFEGTAAPIDDH